MKIAKSLFRFVLILLSIPVLYLLVSLILTEITVNSTPVKVRKTKTIFLTTNGVHLDLIFKAADLDSITLKNLEQKSGGDNFYSFGWGDEKFYLETPTWNDLTFSNAFNASFLNSPTLMHVTRHEEKRAKWIEIQISQNQFDFLKEYVFNSFQIDNERYRLIDSKGYGMNDNFYKAKGSYTFLNTCNTWVNSGLKQCGMKACFWTPFDYGLLDIYK